jgi:hypothetical protein
MEDIVYSYYGNRSGSVLEAKLNGSMKDNAPDEARFRIIQWVRDGAGENAYAREIKPLFEAHCVACHNADSALPDFTRYENIKARAQSDEGATFSSLTRVSHIHMFGIAFIFMFVGMIFALASGVPCKLKCSAILLVAHETRPPFRPVGRHGRRRSRHGLRFHVGGLDVRNVGPAAAIALPGPTRCSEAVLKPPTGLIRRIRSPYAL